MQGVCAPEHSPLSHTRGLHLRDCRSVLVLVSEPDMFLNMSGLGNFPHPLVSAPTPRLGGIQCSVAQLSILPQTQPAFCCILRIYPWDPKLLENVQMEFLHSPSLSQTMAQSSPRMRRLRSLDGSWIRQWPSAFLLH